jgi:hypothetical protein
VDPYENGALVAVKARSPNVETETILTDVVIVPMIGESLVGVAVFSFGPLRSRISEIYGRKNPLPRLGRLRCTETVLPCRGSAVGNSQKGVDVSEDITPHLTV